MPHITRRGFLAGAMLSWAAIGRNNRIFAGEGKKKNAKPTASGNGKLCLAVIGAGQRGMDHVREFADHPDCFVAYVCDVDRTRAVEAAKLVEQLQGRAPKIVQDMRRIFDDRLVDAVSHATCNHWHALGAIWAMQAGKHVYLEKPVSHNVVEGRRIVQASRKYNRICAVGTQMRSNTSIAAGIEYIRKGMLGEVKSARMVCYKTRKSIGPAGEYPVPAGVDYDLWLGPAPNKPITRPQFHYDWHWQWDYGNGDLGNVGVHFADCCRWGLGLDGPGRRVMSFAGRFLWQDAGETPNTQVTVHCYGNKTVVQEVRNLPTDPCRVQGAPIMQGAAFASAEGTVVCTLHEAAIYDVRGRKVRSFPGEAKSPFDNFVQAVQSGIHKKINADILEGHLSTCMSSLGNISHKLGRPASPKEVLTQLETVADCGIDAEILQSMEDHLQRNKVNTEKSRLALGPWLEFDAASETFVGNPDADKLLTRQYRRPFVVPDADDV